MTPSLDEHGYQENLVGLSRPIMETSYLRGDA
jgi:hypothetical protein